MRIKAALLQVYGLKRLIMRRAPRRKLTTGVVLCCVVIIMSGVVIAFGGKARASYCPCSVFDNQAPTGSSLANDGSPLELGLRFRPAIDGFVTGIKFYKNAAMTDAHVGKLWDANGNLLASANSANETVSGWQQVNFSSPIAVTANSLYTASFYTPAGKYVASGGYFTSPVNNFPLTAPSTGTAADGLGNVGNGIFKYQNGGGYPTADFNGGNYWVDVIFMQTNDGSAPQVSSVSPANASSNVYVWSDIAATLSQHLAASTVSTSTVALTAGGTLVPFTVSYNDATRTVKLTPTNPLPPNTTYTAKLKGGVGNITNLDGTPLSSDYQWTFATGSDGCPCSVWNNTSPSNNPGTFFSNGGGTAFGHTVFADQNGYIQAVRFYKPFKSTVSSRPVHVWTTTGTLLATATSSNESEYGWQEVPLPTPVAITQGTEYVISYYSSDDIYTSSAGVLTTQAGSGPLHVKASGAAYRNGGDGFPNINGGGNAVASFWVDAVMTTLPTYTHEFRVDLSQPLANAYGVQRANKLTFKVSDAADNSTVAGSVSVKDSNNNVIAGTTSYDSASHTISFAPTQALLASQRYNVTVGNGLKNTAGTTLTAYTMSFTTGAVQNANINQGLGGPVLIVTSASNPYQTYLAEILRTEGISYFDVRDITQLTPSTLSQYKILLLGQASLNAAQVSDISTWVQSGGDLLAIKPDKQLAPLLGLQDLNQTLNEGYLKIDTSQAPGKGIAAASMQYHTSADLYAALSGTQTVATLYSDATTATPQASPAVSKRSVGKGTAAAYLYDLPKSNALLHQGNPAWAGVNNPSGNVPLRASDMFDGGAQPDWLNVAKASIPQADEQQRLLVNTLTESAKDSMPLPKFWYFPHDIKAALIMASDDHGTATGTLDYMDRSLNNSATNCSLQDWQCARSTSLMYTNSGLTSANATRLQTNGFDFGVHVGASCGNYTSYAQYNNILTSEIADFKAKYTGLVDQRTARNHCYAWSDWDSVGRAERASGIRYDMAYEWYPPSWVGLQPGLLTGSSMSMRFTDVSGQMYDLYQGVTDLTYETDPTTSSADSLLTNALNSNEFYGVFGTHYDFGNNYGDQLLQLTKSKGVAAISGDQMTTWKDALNSSTFNNLSHSNGVTNFTIAVAEGGQGMRAMVPMADAAGTITSIKRDGATATYATQTVKGVAYAKFDAVPGAYTVTYSDVSADDPEDNLAGGSPTIVSDITDTVSGLVDDFGAIFSSGKQDATADSKDDSKRQDDGDVTQSLTPVPTTSDGKTATPSQPKVAKKSSSMTLVGIVAAVSIIVALSLLALVLRRRTSQSPWTEQ